MESHFYSFPLISHSNDSMPMPMSNDQFYRFNQYYYKIICIIMIATLSTSFVFKRSRFPSFRQQLFLEEQVKRTMHGLAKSLVDDSTGIKEKKINDSKESSFLVPEDYWKKKIQETTWYYQLAKNNEEEPKLPFKCTGCGNCCRTKGEVYVSNDELESIHSYFDITTAQQKEEFQATYISKKVNGDGGVILKSQTDSTSCIFLDEATNECKIYDVRPLQCSTYPFWPR